MFLIIGDTTGDSSVGAEWVGETRISSDENYRKVEAPLPARLVLPVIRSNQRPNKKPNPFQDWTQIRVDEPSAVARPQESHTTFTVSMSSPLSLLTDLLFPVGSLKCLIRFLFGRSFNLKDQLIYSDSSTYKLLHCDLLETISPSSTT